MSNIIIIFHLVACIALILIVLLQTGKGASLGAAFGGSTQTVFGTSGSAGFFEKMTTAVAVIFMVTSLSLTYISAKRGGESIMKTPVVEESAQPIKQEKASPAEELPIAPATPFPLEDKGAE